MDRVPLDQLEQELRRELSGPVLAARYADWARQAPVLARLGKARQRLSELYELRVLDRFRPAWQQGEGSTPHHWTLDAAGAHVVAAARGVSRRELHWTREPAAALVASTIREHLHAVNDFATRLHEEARTAGGTLSRWLGERGAHELMRGILTPDSYLALDLPDEPTRHVLLELDRGTEDHERLQTKARRYAKAIPRSHLHKLDPLILLLVPSVGRAQAVAASLADAPRPVAVEPWTPGGESPLALIQRRAATSAAYRGARADDLSSSP